MQSIAEWLKNGTYEQGVQLYEQHGGNSFLKQKFKAGPNEYNTPKLRDELGRLALLAEPEIQNSKVKSQKEELPEPQSSIPDPENAKRYLQLTKRKTRLYLELNILMEQKHHLPEGEELRKCCVDILSHNQQLTETWAMIDYYQEHQCFPEEKPAKKTLDPKDEMQLLRQTISKAKKRLLSPTCRNQAQTETLLALTRNKLAQLVAIKKQRHE